MGNTAVPPSAAPPLPARPRLSGAELAVLQALLDAEGRVIGRREIARRAGLVAQSERRSDAIMVTLRRILGDGSIVTVRRRGWRLDPTAAAHAISYVRSL